MQTSFLGLPVLLLFFFFFLVSPGIKLKKKMLLVTDAQSTILATDVKVKGQAI